jgi:hypothetical protein
VRTAFCLSKQRLPAVEDTFAAAQQYWDEVAQNYAPFSQAMWAADAVDYDELAQLFSSSWL